MSRTKIAIVAIVTSAAIFYFWHLGRADIITDESSYATRAIGLVDFDFGIEQPTPWQWVSSQPPWWMHLSFHDHPPLVFWLQHFSIKLFGENPTAIRIPSALAGIAAVVFVYLIGNKIYGSRTSIDFGSVGLMSALLFAVTVNHVWISRIGLQESVLAALMLASFWAFLRGLENSKWLPLSGVFLGFAFLTKYTALILIPIFGTLMLLQKLQKPLDRLRRSGLEPKVLEPQTPQKFLFYFLLSFFLFLAIASPVIIYNLQLYRTFGHFDFQFSLLFGQDVPAWQARPGQEVLGSYTDRIRTFIPRLIESNSPYFLVLSALGLAVILWELIRRHRAFVISHSSFVIVFVWLLPFLVFTGPAPRFLTMLTPWLAIAAGYLIAQISYSQILNPAAEQARYGAGNLRIVAVAVAACAAFVAFEAFYSYNSVMALDPVGGKPWAYSYLHRQAGSWGFNELNAYLDAELKGKMPDPAITFEFPFAREILGRARAEGLSRGLEQTPVGIVYNDNINLAAQLWVFLRRITYQGWPVVSAENFRRGGAAEFLRQSGVQKIYFINATEYALQDRPRPPAPDGDILEAELESRGVTPTEIRNPRGEIAFRVYQFELR